MFDYLGIPCPYCNEPFKEGDDIAVCPDCGTPHHRACYAEHGQCANTDRHAKGYDWQRDQKIMAADAGEPVSGTFPCPACGRQVEAGSAFCNYCGTPFNKQIGPYVEQPPARAQDSNISAPPPPDFFSADEYYENVMDEVRRDKEIDGIDIKDWFTYIGTSAGYYLGYFKIQDKTGRKTAFTASAMLAPVLYFLYRKVWLVAAAALAGRVVFSLPSALLAFQQMGMFTLANPQLWTTLSRFFPYLGMILNLGWGMYAVHIYRTASGRQIKSLRESSADGQEFQVRLARESGPSAIAVLLFVCALLGLAMLSGLPLADFSY